MNPYKRNELLVEGVRQLSDALAAFKQVYAESDEDASWLAEVIDKVAWCIDQPFGPDEEEDED